MVAKLPDGSSFHSISFPSEWGPLDFKPLPSKGSRGSWRGGLILYIQNFKIPLKKSLKSLPVKTARGSTQESAFQLFTDPLAERWYKIQIITDPGHPVTDGPTPQVFTCPNVCRDRG